MVSTGTIRTRPFDAATCPRATLADLSRQKVQEFLATAKAERGYPLGQKTPTPTVLSHLNLLDEGRLGHAAILLFGKKPQRFLITSEVKCLHFYGTTVAKPFSDYKIFKGTVFEMADQAVEFVLNKIAAAVGTRAESNQVPVTFEIPRQAIAEAIVNAIAHRDYTSNASVQVMLFADRLEVWNPGELPPSLTFEDLRRPHASVPRNPLIAEPMYLTRHIERAGTGILDMIGLCKAAGLRPPKFSQSGGQFIQTIWRPKAATVAQVEPPKAPARNQAGEQPAQSGLGERLGEKLGETELQILQLILRDRHITIPRMAKEIGISETAVEKNLAKLKKRGVLRHVGPAKGGHREVLLD